MNKIPELALKIADGQDLLTKDVSLALKPDNWIEWDNTSMLRLGFSKNFFFQYVRLDSEMVSKIIVLDKAMTVVFLIDKIISVFEAKQACQNWLDEKLKVNNESISKMS